ncbi:BadF/BadG/BcrA/BcrD ATPase family protein [Marivita sp.]|uniref:BadF/BadG/BcrA/BcrD ATPase family protein n=1 Tax=Marivita sp. TaxID=2003365 RepID=UPI003F6AC235
MNQASTFVIGVDGGGTGCRVAISDGLGNVIGSSSGGAANYTSDPARTVKHIIAALTEAATGAGLSLEDLKAAPTHIGLAGVVSKTDADQVAKALPFAHCMVSEDQTTTVAGALGHQKGAVVSVGTGSFVAIKRDTKIRFIGGWGLHLGDQASGAWLGQQALQRCALVLDGLVDTSDFVETLVQQIGRKPGDMITFARNATPEVYANIAPDIMAAAKALDPNALTLVEAGADYLNQCLGIASLNKDEVVCLTGGLGPYYEHWLDDTFQARVTKPNGTALDGALFLSRQMLEEQVTT